MRVGSDKSLISSKGFGLIEILVVVVVVALLAGGGYVYWKSQSGDNGSSLTEEQKVVRDNCLVEIDDELLCRAFSVMDGGLSNESYTISATMANASGQESFITSKYRGEDYHAVTRVDGQTTESMKLGNDMYLKMEGQWYRQEPLDLSGDEDLLDAGIPDMASYFDKEEVAKTRFNRLGNEACGNGQCVKYEIYAEGAMGSKVLIWIDKDKDRILRMQTDDSDGSKIDVTYEYGAVEITPPADAKEMSELTGW